ESAGCDTRHAVAARPKCRSRASAVRYSSCRRNTVAHAIAWADSSRLSGGSPKRLDAHTGTVVRSRSLCSVEPRRRSSRPPEVMPVATVLCVLYDDPVDGHPTGYAREDIPTIEHYPDGQTTPTPSAIDFTPGELLGDVSGELGLRKFLEDDGHTLIVT